jgi:cell division protein ZapE
MPYQRYRKDLQQGDFHHDPAQEKAIQHLQRIHDELQTTARLTANSKTGQGGLLARLMGRNTRPPAGAAAPVTGLYLWGGVGRGKTYVVDTFFAALPLAEKKRTHFHRFIHGVHQELKQLRHQQNPLCSVAQHFAGQARVICLDEFFVSDITDAMILSGLLQALFAQGVTLITTSNIPPDELYKDGLQRARFLPAIELIKTHMEVFHLDGGVDYRLRYLEKAEIYHSPLDAGATRILEDTVTQLAPEAARTGVVLEINGRPIPTRLHADGIVLLDFEAICDGPRSQSDYIEIARCYHTVLIADVPVMDWQMENQARRFLNLVDEFYDRGVKLIVSAAAPVEKLYAGKKLQFEYRRTVSRLHEMQSHAYLAREHLP